MSSPPPPPSSSSPPLLTLPSSRTLSYSIYNHPLSPSVPIILYFHGFPTSRLETSHLSTLPISSQIPFTIIAPDRPGFGLSTFLPGRRISDWPADVEFLLEHLKIDKFHLLAGSGGSPFALACTKIFTRERLLSTTIVSGIYPLSLGTESMLLPVKVLLLAGQYLPTFILKRVMEWEFGGRDGKDRERFEENFMRVMEKRSERDRKCLDDLPFRKCMIDAMMEGFGQGAEGAAWEVGLFGDWGFRLDEIETEIGDGDGKVVLWHGRGDINAPVSMAEKAAKLIRGSELKIVEGETHLSLPYNCMEEILRGVLKA